MRRCLPDVSRRARALPLAPFTVALAIAIGGCNGARVDVDVARARGHVDALAATIGNRPVGSPAAARARAYLIDQLERTGFAVRLQQSDSVDEARGLTVPVVNIVASKAGAEPAAVALVTHYDSAPDAAGALDDGLGVAVCLESARLLASEPLRHSLMVILTDGEEAGMMGALAVVRDPEVARRVRAFLNFDGTGAAGPPLLFEAAIGADGRSALGAWAAGAPRPAGGSFSTEIYRRLPNDTDFTIFRSLGAPGLNFAPVGDSYAYHTDRDVAARVNSETLRQAIANAVGTVRQMNRDELGASIAELSQGRHVAAILRAAEAGDRAGEPTYFDVGGTLGVTYGAQAAQVLAWTAVLIAALAWLVQLRRLSRERGATGVLLTIAWGLSSTIATVLAMAGVGATLAAAREPVQYWYAAPHWLFVSTIAAGLLAWMLIRAVARRAPDRVRPLKGPHAAWLLALPAWIALTIALHVTATAASYLTAVPLLVAAVTLPAAGTRDSRLRVASAISLVVAAHFWIPDTARLLAFMVPLFGWMGIVPPAWIFAALMAVALLMCGPPAAAVVAGFRPRAASFAILAAMTAAAIALAANAPAYTAHRPERRMLRFVQDDVQQRAWWEQGGAEPRVVADGDAPVSGGWLPVRSGPEATTTVGPVFGAFRFRAEARGLVTAPADARVSSIPRDGDLLEVIVRVIPRGYIRATIVLPPGVTPRESSLEGVLDGSRWRATYIAPPASGLDVRLIVDARHAAVMADTLVVASTYAVPGAAPGRRVPSWVPDEAITWQPRGLYIVRATQEARQPAPTAVR